MLRIFLNSENASTKKVSFLCRIDFEPYEDSILSFQHPLSCLLFVYEAKLIVEILFIINKIFFYTRLLLSIIWF